MLVTTLFPVMGGLAARGRNGWGRLLLIAAFVYVYALGSTSLMIALLFGFATLSFAVSDLRRTTRDLAWIAAALMALGPLVDHRHRRTDARRDEFRPRGLDPPFATLARAHAMVIHEKLLLVTGHGFEALVRAMQTGIFPADDAERPDCSRSGTNWASSAPRIAAAMIWFGFRRIADAPPRLAPYLAAALACNLTLGALLENFGDMLWTVSLGIAVHRRRRRRAQPVPHDAALGGGAGAVLKLGGGWDAPCRARPRRRPRRASGAGARDPSGMAIRAGLVKSSAIRPVMSATLKLSPAR